MPKIDKELIAIFIPSPAAKARIAGIDTKKALVCPLSVTSNGWNMHCAAMLSGCPWGACSIHSSWYPWRQFLWESMHEGWFSFLSFMMHWASLCYLNSSCIRSHHNCKPICEFHLWMLSWLHFHMIQLLADGYVHYAGQPVAVLLAGMSFVY